MDRKDHCVVCIAEGACLLSVPHCWLCLAASSVRRKAPSCHAPSRALLWLSAGAAWVVAATSAAWAVVAPAARPLLHRTQPPLPTQPTTSLCRRGPGHHGLQRAQGHRRQRQPHPAGTRGGRAWGGSTLPPCRRPCVSAHLNLAWGQPVDLRAKLVLWTSSAEPPQASLPRGLQDIGVFLRDIFRQRFKGIDVKYIGEPHVCFKAAEAAIQSRVRGLRMAVCPWLLPPCVWASGKLSDASPQLCRPAD